MILRNIFSTAQRAERAHGGQGILHVSRPLNQTDFMGPWHFVDYAILPPNTSIGIHQHGDNEELYFIVDGEGTMIVNSEKRRVSKGDLILNPPGSSHGLINDSGATLSILVVEVGLKS